MTPLVSIAWLPPHSIEQYCQRRLFRKKHVEILGFSGKLIIPLKEYPVRSILEVKKRYTPPKTPYCEDAWETLLTL
jgi:hypothetical protein